MTHPRGCVHYLDSFGEEAGGVVRSVIDLCQLLAEHGHRVDVLARNPGDAPPSWSGGDGAGPRMTAFAPFRSGFGRFPAAPRKQATGLIERADVLHMHAIWDPLSLRLASLARRSRTPYIVSLHGMLNRPALRQKHLKKRLYLAAVGRRLLENAAAVHCTAEAEAAQVARWSPGANVEVAPHCVQAIADSPGRTPAEEAFPAAFCGRPVILFLSRIHPIKGIDVLLKAVAMLDQRGLAVTLVIAGPDRVNYLAELDRLATELGVRDRVHFTGMVRGELKASLVEACDIFALPSKQENFGLALVEAMALGRPVLASQGVDIWRELESGGATIVPRTPEAYRDALQKLLKDKPHAEQLGQRGKRFIAEWLDRDRVAEEYQRIYAAAGAG